MIHRPPIIDHRLAESPSFPGDLFITLCDEYNKTTHTVFWKSYFLTFWFTLSIFLLARISQNKVLITPQSVVTYWVIFHIHQNINLISRYTIVVVFFPVIIFLWEKMLLDKVLQMFFFQLILPLISLAYFLGKIFYDLVGGIMNSFWLAFWQLKCKF